MSTSILLTQWNSVRFTFFPLKMTTLVWFSVSILPGLPVYSILMIIFLSFHRTNLSLTLYIRIFFHPSPCKHSQNPIPFSSFSAKLILTSTKEGNNSAWCWFLRHTKSNHDWIAKSKHSILLSVLVWEVSLVSSKRLVYIGTLWNLEAGQRFQVKDQTYCKIQFLK